MTSPSLQSKLEALLFISGEPIAEHRLMELLHIDQSELTQVIQALKKRYSEDSQVGLMLIEHQGKVEMATKKDLATLIEAFTKTTLQDALSKAALEVLAIIAYRAPIARSDIEAIRGVNCSYTLRALLIRGLIERRGNPTDARGYMYWPAFQFLEHLGLSRIEDLPDYQSLSQDERMHVISQASTESSTNYQSQES